MTEVDIKYLREKNIPTLIEKLAADIVQRKPADPEAYLKEKFSLSGGDVADRGTAAVIFGPVLEPKTGVALLAASASGFAVDFRDVDLSLPSSDFLGISPLRRAPALDHQGTLVTEVGAVARFLAANSATLPLSSIPRSKIESAFDVIVATSLADVSTAVDEKVFSPKQKNRPVDQLAVTAAVEKAKASTASLSQAYFKESHWTVGKELSLADFALASSLFSLHHVLGVDVAALGEPLNRFWNAVSSQPFYTEGLKQFTAAAMAYQ